MKKISFLLWFILLAQLSFAQKINRLGIQMTVDAAWQEKADVTDKIRINARKKSAVIEIYQIGKKSSEEAAFALMDILKTHNVKPIDFEKAPKNNQKIGKISVVSFEYIDKTELESQKETLNQLWITYLMEIKGVKYVIWTSEYYLNGKECTLKSEVEKMIKTIK